MSASMRKVHDDELPAPLVKLEEHLASDPSRAFAPEIINAAARLDDTSSAFQRALTIVQNAGARIRDWRSAVKARRQELLARRAQYEIRRREASRTPEEAIIAKLRSELLLNDQGKVRKCLANLSTIFHRDPRWQDKLAYHSLREAVVKVEPIPWHPDDAPAMPEAGPWTDADATRASAWLSREWGLDFPSKPIEEVIEAIARKRIIDPLVDYLGALRHDGVPRIDTWLSTYMGAADTPYTRAVGARWLISAVARAFKPGCKVDCVLILEGGQGIGKSTALRNLCADPAWFFDDELPLGTKDAAQHIRGKWIVELGELSVLTRHELAVIKSFITRQVDTHRPSFGRRAVDLPRHCVFAGSTNEDTYLRDDENRRFWPVRCGDVDYDGLARDRDQIWAEATSRFLRGERWHVDSPELASLCRAEQEERVQGDPWEEAVSQWLNKLLAQPCRAHFRGPTCECVRCKGVTASRALLGAVGVETARQTRADDARMGTILRRLGWKRGKLARRDGGRVRPFYPPTQDINTGDSNEQQ